MRLVRELGDDVEVILIDRADSFVFGFSKLDVMFGRRIGEGVVHPYLDIVKPGVRFVQTTIRSIDPDLAAVETDAGPFDGDVMVVALGADLDPSATPGLMEGGHEFYTGPARSPPGTCWRASTVDAWWSGHLDAVQVPTRAE